MEVSVALETLTPKVSSKRSAESWKDYSSHNFLLILIKL